MMSGGEFLEDEIQAAVFGLGGDKALGPNGFPIAFIQQFRDLIKDELIQFVKEFHDNGKIAGALGASFIVLIPKKGRAYIYKRLSTEKPYLGGPYKISAKVLANAYGMCFRR